jgi:hypothetical protein
MVTTGDADTALLFESSPRPGATSDVLFSSLDAARRDPRSILVVEGLEGGYVLLTCPVSLIASDDIAVGLLAADLHAVSFLLGGLERETVSLWLERHDGGRRVRGRALGRARVMPSSAWLLDPWGWHPTATSPSDDLRVQLDAVLGGRAPRIDAEVLHAERRRRVVEVERARRGPIGDELARFGRSWDYDVEDPVVDFDLAATAARDRFVQALVAARS